MALAMRGAGHGQARPAANRYRFGQPADNAVLALARGLQVVDVRLREPAHEAEQRAWSAGRGLNASQRRGLPRGGGGAAARKRVERLRGGVQGCDWGVWRRRTSHDMAKAAVFWAQRDLRLRLLIRKRRQLQLIFLSSGHGMV